MDSWRGGANYAVNDNLGVYGNLSTGFRAPSIDQLYRGSISPTGGKTANNENLKPEQALNTKSDCVRRTACPGVPFDWDAALFQVDRKDFILATSGQYGGTSTTYVEKYDNIGGVQQPRFRTVAEERSQARGLCRLRLHLHFRLLHQVRPVRPEYSAALTHRDATTVYNNTGRHVPRVPTHVLNAT